MDVVNTTGNNKLLVYFLRTGRPTYRAAPVRLVYEAAVVKNSYRITDGLFLSDLLQVLEGILFTVRTENSALTWLLACGWLEVEDL